MVSPRPCTFSLLLPFGVLFLLCHRFLLPPASYKRTQETCLSSHPAMRCPRSAEKEEKEEEEEKKETAAAAAGARLPTRRRLYAQAGDCAHRNTEARCSLTLSSSFTVLSSFRFALSHFCLFLSLAVSYMLSPPRHAARSSPFKRTLVAKFSPLTLSSPNIPRLERTALLHGRVGRNNFVDYTPVRNRFASHTTGRHVTTRSECFDKDTADV